MSASDAKTSHQFPRIVPGLQAAGINDTGRDRYSPLTVYQACLLHHLPAPAPSLTELNKKTTPLLVFLAAHSSSKFLLKLKVLMVVYQGLNSSTSVWFPERKPQSRIIFGYVKINDFPRFVYLDDSACTKAGLYLYPIARLDTDSNEKSSVYEDSNEKSSVYEDSNEKSSVYEDSNEKSSDYEDSNEKSSDYEDSNEKSSVYEDSNEKSSDYEDSNEKSSDYEDSNEKSSDYEDSNEKSSVYEDSNEKSSVYEDSNEKSNQNQYQSNKRNRCFLEEECGIVPTLTPWHTVAVFSRVSSRLFHNQDIFYLKSEQQVFS
ncbi:hypothetical protein RRG08_003052 [Elysia crispata]|uniref:Uncharacterized protein n=1 Tax=Elysia crispata TaxID=231223 RepID=A0AAE1B6V4_9GAST|nr:hypothetical protein RRG08_003052 [Elysia crispata]